MEILELSRKIDALAGDIVGIREANARRNGRYENIDDTLRRIEAMLGALPCATRAIDIERVRSEYKADIAAIEQSLKLFAQGSKMTDEAHTKNWGRVEKAVWGLLSGSIGAAGALVARAILEGGVP